MSNSSPSQFNESTVRGHDYGSILIENPNQDLVASGVLKSPLKTRGLNPLERVFPPAYASLQMGSHWNVTELVQQQISKSNTGLQCPFKWSIWVTDNKCVEVYAEYNNETFTIYVPMFGDFTLKDVIRKQIDNVPTDFDIVGRIGARSTHITINNVRTNVVDDNEMTVVPQNSEHIRVAKRQKRV